MIERLKNIQTGYTFSRRVTIATLIGSLCFSLGVTAFAFYFVYLKDQRIYVLDNGRSLILALSQDAHTNRQAEARSHLIRFHELFFTLAPNKESIKYNTERALHLADNSALTIYRNMEEQKYFNDLIAASASLEFRADSVVLNMDVYPYYAKVYGKTSFIRTSLIAINRLESECFLRTVSRSDVNPHGFIIERLRILNNDKLKETER